MKLQTKLFFFIIIFSLVNSCKSKKVITDYKEIIKKDTIYTTKIVKEVEKYTDTITIENPCDSLGNLKHFKQVINTVQGNITLKGLNDSITAEIDLKGYKDVLERTYQLKYDKKVSELNEVEVIYKTPFWHWLAHLLSLVVVYLYVKKLL